jgi:predicted nucleotidyltransferase
MPEAIRLSNGQVETLRQLQVIAGALNLQDQLMLIGATARLLLLDWPLNLTRRTTEDIDFVVQVDDWSQHQALINLAHKAGFQEMPQEYRLRHLATGTLIDLVPFGGLEKPEGTIKWPRCEQEMSVRGMHEAHHAAIVVEVAPGLKSRVITLPCLVVLKMFAWMDRRFTDKGHSDLVDANFILSHCQELPEFEKSSWDVFEKAAIIAKLLERPHLLDYKEHVGVAIVGTILQAVLRLETKSCLRSILDPLAEDAYHPAIEKLMPFFHTNEQDREVISLRFAMLAHFLSV